jgi:hypothetical protein
MRPAGDALGRSDTGDTATIACRRDQAGPGSSSKIAVALAESAAFARTFDFVMGFGCMHYSAAGPAQWGQPLRPLDDLQMRNVR